MELTSANSEMVDVRQASRYQKALGFLFDRINHELATRMPYSRRDLNISRMRRLLELLGDPHRKSKVIHIAGTKGKGSTAAFLTAAFVAAGKRCGSYTSPHLQHIEERFCIDGKPCSPETLIELIELARPAVVEMDDNYEGGGPTYFEIATAIAFQLFVQTKVDVAILEVGLGGRLDSTNVCHPMISAITSISFDHMKQLGNTLAEIAGEKAGIIKSGIPVISGVVNDEAKFVIVAKSAERNSALLQRGVDFGFENYRPSKDEYLLCQADLMGLDGSKLEAVELGLPGEHQAANASVALAVLQSLPGDLQPDDEAIRQGFSAVRCLARIEIIGHRPTTIVDAAHNVASAKALVDVLQSTFVTRRRHLLLGATRGKDVVGMLRLLLPQFEHVVCARYENNPRGYDAEALCKLAEETKKELGLNNVNSITHYESPEHAWRKIRELSDPSDLICVTGSFFIASEVRQLALSTRVGSVD